MTRDFEAELWLWDARKADTWTFASVPPDVSDDLAEVAEPVARGFGSVRVEARLGGTVWRTSLFPDSGRGTYVLPIKKAVRDREGVQAGDTAHLSVTLLDV